MDFLGTVIEVTNRTDENKVVLVLHLHLKKLLEAFHFVLLGTLNQHVNHLLTLQRDHKGNSCGTIMGRAGVSETSRIERSPAMPASKA